MKTKYFKKLMAAVMAAIFMFMSLPAFAYFSREQVDLDYRNMEILDRNDKRIKKPTSEFLAQRVVDGEVVDMVRSYTGYDCTTEFTTLECYVGDTVTFHDLSYDNNSGGKIIEWDWQYYGTIGNSAEVRRYNVVNETSFTLTEPGETVFYLCVRNDKKVKNGCVDPWSDNGNHQIVGHNKWFPNGAYWYFSTIRIITKPVREANVCVRYWDAQNNKLIYEENLLGGKLLEDDDTATVSAKITDWDGYRFSGWNVTLPDGTVQYSGTERNVTVSVAGWLPLKYLDVEFYPYMPTALEVSYWDTAKNSLLHTDKISGEWVVQNNETKISAPLSAPSGYRIVDWTLSLQNGTVQDTGTIHPVTATLTGFVPLKYLNVNCVPISDKDTGDDDGETYLPPPKLDLPGDCDGIITWTESDSHKVFDGYTKTGKKKYKTCRHTFTYQAVLTANAEASPNVFKSGYGFELEVDCDIDVQLISRDGGCESWGRNREPEEEVQEPTTATVYLPWDMTNRLGSQGRTVSMEQNGRMSFCLPVSPVSEAGARKIYTPVELPGTEKEPVTHGFEIYIGGGGIDRTEFCVKLDEQITINGDMYSDDFSGAN